MALDSTEKCSGLPLGEERIKLNRELRKFKQSAFSIDKNSSARSSTPWKNPLEGGKTYSVYGNCNLSIYSGASCNGNCPFCVEKLRPLSRGCLLEDQKENIDDTSYFRALDAALRAVKPLNPSVSITGGEPSLDPRLPRMISLLKHHGFRKRTMTTNGSGLVKNHFLESLISGGFSHLNLSRAHHDDELNQEFMQLDPFIPNKDLYQIIARLRDTRLRPRLSCVLLNEGINDLNGIIDYLEWAASIGVDNVVFRQLMDFDRSTYRSDPIVDYTMKNQVLISKILKQIFDDSGDCIPRFDFTKQVVGYYYYVEVYQYQSRIEKKIDVVFEEANLTFIEIDKKRNEEVSRVHELIFHPTGTLCSTWQPWDGILMR
ncbi:MAG: radical SAM protein [Candidatus Hodarchaeota archaeon]